MGGGMNNDARAQLSRTCSICSTEFDVQRSVCFFALFLFVFVLLQKKKKECSHQVRKAPVHNPSLEISRCRGTLSLLWPLRCIE